MGTGDRRRGSKIQAHTGSIERHTAYSSSTDQRGMMTWRFVVALFDIIIKIRISVETRGK
jgi:hypothetical protein